MCEVLQVNPRKLGASCMFLRLLEAVSNGDPHLSDVFDEVLAAVPPDPTLRLQIEPMEEQH